LKGNDEILGKAIDVSANLFVEAPGRDPVKTGQILIQQHTLPANDADLLRDIGQVLVACTGHRTSMAVGRSS
jgi:hypothetical protein